MQSVLVVNDEQLVDAGVIGEEFVRAGDGVAGLLEIKRAAECLMPGAEACPAEATVGGTREELLAEARKRIAENPGAYHPVIYGEHEVGGTNVLVLSPVPFEQLGMRTGLGTDPLPLRPNASSMIARRRASDSGEGGSKSCIS